MNGAGKVKKEKGKVEVKAVNYAREDRFLLYF